MSDEEVFFDLESLLECLWAALPESGGAFTVEAILRRMEAGDVGALAGFTPAAKLALVRRLLEVSTSIATTGRKILPMFLAMNRRTGRILQPRRPRGVEPVGDEVFFFPKA